MTLLVPVGDYPVNPPMSVLNFAELVEGYRRQVIEEFPEPSRARLRATPCHVIGAEGTTDDGGVFISRWGEFYLPDGPIVLYHAAFEAMPDIENYHRQVRDVLRHEMRHALGQDNHDGFQFEHFSAGDARWTGSGPYAVRHGAWLVTLP